ncbi:MAG: triose-phosphate isomerase [Kiritimatiellaeota bacterium]|nr:triose-phosphate isomerase [Kiritimatiellota bacterium]
MNKTAAETRALIAEVRAATADGAGAAEVVVCPPFTNLQAAAEALKGSRIKLGAQNMHWKASGAFTGEISADMLKDLGVTHVIIGHSERRQYFAETDETVNNKVKAALAAGLVPIVCVGETLAEREGGKMEAVVTGQVKAGLAGISAELAGIIIAYEPVWAIGTGRTATEAEAQEVHALIRATIAGMSDSATAAKVRIQYGGSMNAKNAAGLLAQPDIDGGLIGGAALKAEDFAAIVKAAG